MSLLTDWAQGLGRGRARNEGRLSGWTAVPPTGICGPEGGAG